MTTPEHRDYAASKIRKTTWGSIRALEDGSFETAWHLTFHTPQDPKESEVYRDDRIGFQAALNITDQFAAELLVTTRDSAMSAAYYPPTFKSFGLVDDTIAELATIEGHPKDWYAPFRDRK
ncbi:hypothetical protein ACFVAV_01075 [Nocardia sp. NPDC057663]|uniref:hypothetical protein n=1 Tax=Nocardia sp. NPDC057663 TaxID=3346201 RepID=UPI00366B9C9B